MADYPSNEIVDMTYDISFRGCHNNYDAASRLYAECFPDRRYLNNTTIRRLIL